MTAGNVEIDDQSFVVNVRSCSIVYTLHGFTDDDTQFIVGQTLDIFRQEAVRAGFGSNYNIEKIV